MKKFSLLKDECPICTGSRKDCRRSDETGMIFCRESSANPTGFIFRGNDKWGFSLWQPSEDAEAFAQKSREEWQREQQRRQEENERRRQQQIAQQLAAVERHKYYSKILDQLPLREIDRLDLERRGFSSQEIEADGHRSVEQWQEVLGAFPSNLPGLLSNGKLNSFPGYIFPVRDIHGLIIALGIRLRDGSSGRYRWLTSATKKNPDGATPHLNAELPLAVFEPSEYQGSGIWLTEGVAVKPSLTRYRRGVPVVGASSGLFSGSPNTCRVTLEKLSTKYQTQNLVIAVDAGDVQNAQVCQRWKREFKFLQSLGYELQVAWWGQITKDCSDIDELADFSAIHYISPDEFLQLFEQEIGAKKPEPVNSEENLVNYEEILAEYARRIEQNPSDVGLWHDRGLCLNGMASRNQTVGQIEDYRRLSLEAVAAFEKAIALSAETCKGVNIAEHSKFFRDSILEQLANLDAEIDEKPILSESDNENGIRLRIIRKSLDEFLPTFPQLESQSGQDWLKMRKFTPDYTINSKYFDWESDKPGVHLAVNSGLGTGKTYHVHTKFLADENKGAVAPGYRNALLTQFTENGTKLGGKTWYHLQQDLKQSREDMSLLSDPHSRISGCVDSLIYFNPQNFEGKRLVFDEVEGTFKHLCQSKTAVSFHRQVCKQRTGEAIANAEAVMLLDGNLTDLTVAHVERISGKKFTKIKNLYNGNRGKVTFYTGTLKQKKDDESAEIKTERRVNDYSLLHKKMMEDEAPFVTGSDSQEKLEAWDNLLKAKGRRTFRLDGTNSNSPEAKKFLASPKDYILENKIQVVLYSPTAESGLSIDLEGYFKRQYFFFFGVVLTNEQTQFLARLRDPNAHIYVYCQNQHQKCGSPDLSSEELQKSFIQFALDCSQLSLADIPEEDKRQKLTELATELIQKSNDSHFQYECHLQAKEVFERNHLRNCLEYALRVAGYQVEVVTGYKVSTKELEAEREQTQIRKSQQLLEAQSLSSDQVKEKMRDFMNASPQDKIEVAKHRLLSRLPGIEDKHETITKVITIPMEVLPVVQSGRVPIEIAKDLGISTPETPSPQALEAVHLPQDFSISQSEGGQFTEGGQVQIEVTQTRPIFSAEFIRKVKFQNRALIPQVELHYLLTNPDIARLLQQRKWYKKLQVFTDINEPDCLKRINLTSYKSDYLRVDALLRMGIGFFLQPGATWTQDTPEAVEFWQKGKDSRTARYIGVQVGDSKPCEYVGRVLTRLDIKTKSEKVSLSGGRVRVYRVDEAYLRSPVREALFQCVEQRISDVVKGEAFAFDWDAVIQNQWSGESVGNQEVSIPEMQSPQGLEPVHLPQNFSISQSEGGQVATPGEALTTAVTAEARSLANLLSEAVEHGRDTIVSVLSRLNVFKRWDAVTALEALFPDRFQVFLSSMPDIFESSLLSVAPEAG